MTLTSIGQIWDRISSIVVAQGFMRARNPFDFDQQPDDNLDVTFHMKSNRDGTDGYLGGDQAEQHTIQIFCARRAKRDAWGAARQLKADMDIIEGIAVNDFPVFDYVVIDGGVNSEIRDPASTQDFVVGLLALKVDFDRII